MIVLYLHAAYSWLTSLLITRVNIGRQVSMGDDPMLGNFLPRMKARVSRTAPLILSCEY